MDQMPHSIIKRVAFIGNYLPRQCGIATFTTDLCEAIADQFKETACIALPVNDIESGYNYPARVRFELAEKDIESYRRAADFLNINNVDMVSLQHEYGIFGGRAGSYILSLLRELRMPVVTTLHTILREPDPDQRRVLEEIVSLSDRVVVMSKRGAEFLGSIYHVPEGKIDLIPHGIPDVPFVDPSFNKDIFGLISSTRVRETAGALWRAGAGAPNLDPVAAHFTLVDLEPFGGHRVAPFSGLVRKAWSRRPVPRGWPVRFRGYGGHAPGPVPGGS
jgi:glycosyltransferase involved in cell wall biosynthesis